MQLHCVALPSCDDMLYRGLILYPLKPIMRAVSLGRAAVHYVDADHGRQYVAMPEKFAHPADIIAPSQSV